MSPLVIDTLKLGFEVLSCIYSVSVVICNMITIINANNKCLTFFTKSFSFLKKMFIRYVLYRNENALSQKYWRAETRSSEAGGVNTARRASVGSLYKLRSIRSPLKNTSSQKRVGRAEAGSEKYYWSQKAGEETPNPSPVELLLR